MRVELHQCFILHQKPYRETSLLLEVFSEHHGRVGLVAKGANRGKNGIRNLCQPFLPLLMGWSGRGELGNLVNIELDGPGSQTIGRLSGTRLFSGFYLNELLIRLLHRNDPYPELFVVYRQAITDLAGTDCMESRLRFFEKRLLDELGYGLILDHEVRTSEAICAEQYYDYLLEQGPRLSSAGIKQAGVRVSGATLLSLLHEVSLDDENLRREAKKLMRYAINHHLGDKPLHSRRIFQSIKHE